MHTKLLTFVIPSLVLVLLSGSTAMAQAVSVIEPGPTIPPLFQGYDSKTGQMKTAICVQKDTGRSTVERRMAFSQMSNEPTTPQLVNYSISHIQDSETLQSTLNINASGSFSYGMYSASASYKYFSESNFSAYSEYLAVQVEVENQSENYPNVKFLTKAQKLIDKKDYVGFYKLCGDQFVDGQVKGGLFLAMAKFDTTTSSEQATTSAALQGTVGLYGSVAADMTKNLKKLSTYSNVQVQILRKAPNATIDDSIPGIIKYAQELPNMVAGDNGYVTKLIVAEYPGDPVGSIPPTQAQTIDRLARLLGKAYRRKADLKYVQEHQDQFPQITKTALAQNEDELEALISAVKTTAQLCGLDSKKCAIAKYPSIPDLPARAEWIELKEDKNAKACPPEKIAETKKDENLSIEMHGYWSAWDSGERWLGVNQSNLFLQDHDGTKTIKITPQADVLYPVPPYSVVKWMAADGPDCAAFADNRVKQDAPISFRMFDESPIPKVDFGSLPNGSVRAHNTPKSVSTSPK